MDICDPFLEITRSGHLPGVPGWLVVVCGAIRRIAVLASSVLSFPLSAFMCRVSGRLWC